MLGFKNRVFKGNIKRVKTWFSLVLLFLFLGLVFAYPTLDFYLPTETNNTYISTNWTEINSTISMNETLDTFDFDWDYTERNDYLVGYWRLDESSGANAYDSSGTGNNGTLSGMNTGLNNGTSGWTTSGKKQNAAMFDGSNDYINCGNDPSLNITNAITIEAWVKIPASPSETDEAIVNNYAGTYTGYLLTIDTNRQGRFRIGRQSDSTLKTVKSAELSLNTWHHLVGVYDGIRPIIYLNGIKTEGGVYFPRESGTANTIIGKAQWHDRYFNGTIDEVRIYNTSLTPEQIKQRYLSTRARFYDDSLVLAMNFNNNSAIGENSTKAVDISKYGNNGTINSATWTTQGKFGGAMNFDGTDDYINCGNDPSLNITDAITIEVWVKTSDTSGGEMQIYAKTGTLSRNVFGMNMNQPRFYIRDIEGDMGDLRGTTNAINDGNWHHLVGVREGTTSIIYLDGISHASNSYPAVGDISTTGTAYIGRWKSATHYFNGTIDEVRIYNRALSAGEISMHYQSEFQKYNSTQYRFYNNVTNLTDGSYDYYGWANDITGNENSSEVRTLIVDITNPLVTGINWITTGGFTDDTLIYNQIIDWVAVTVNDTNLKEVNITIYDPDNTAVVNNQAMTNSTATNWNYTSNINLNKVGNWNITITGYDYANNSHKNSTTFSVSTQTLSSKDGWYGCTKENISSSAEIITFASYDCDLLEIEDNISTLATNWNTVLTAINNSNTQNMRVGLNYLLNFDYNSSSEKTSALENISATFSDLTGDPYSDVVEYISFELVNPSSYNDSTKYTTLNDLAENATGEFSNKFIIYSKNYNNSNLDNSYISYTKMIYVNEITQASLINTENSLLKYNNSLNRVYVNLSSTLMAQTQDYQTNILGKLRGSPKLDSTVSDTRIAEINTSVNDFVVFNNQSSSQNISVDITNITGYSGKDAWDGTNGLLSDNNTDGTFNVLVSGYSATIVFLENLDHIQMTSDSEGSVYKGRASSTENFNYTNDTKDGIWTLYGANDAKIELFDPHYKINTFITYYGWINASYVTNWSAYDIIIFDDETTDAVSTLLSATTTTDLYCYISVADYNNSDAWSGGKETEVDNCLALNSSTRLNVFVDGMDAGAGGTNFSIRMKNLVDYIKITKDRKAGLNTYTSYEDFCSWSKPDGFCMKESCVRRWNGVDSSNPDNYTFENWTLELEKSEWYQSHDVNILCQAFDNRTTSDWSQQITNRTRVEDVYFASLVLGYDNFYLSQPDFLYAHEIYLYDVGEDLANTYSTDDNETYYRAYSNGIVYYNSSSHNGWIDDGREINNVELCFKLIDNQDGAGNEDDDFWFRVNGLRTSDYEFTASEVTWSAEGIWYCKNLSSEHYATDSGAYYVTAQMEHRGQSSDGIALCSDSNIEGAGRHSWWDNYADATYQWNAYAQNQNWMVRVSVNETKKSSVDTTTQITQSETTSGSYTNISLTSTYDFNIEVWSDFVEVNLTNFVGLKYWNTTDWVTLSPEYNSNCDSDNPTFNSTTISGEVHKSCYKDTGFRVAPPTLSSRIYRIQFNTAPTIIANATSPSTVYTNTDWLINLTITDGDSGDTLTGYVQFYINDSSSGSVHSQNVSNNTNTLIATLGSGSFTKNCNLTAEVWAGDGTENISKVNLTVVTVSNSAPTITTLLTSVSINANGTAWEYDYNATDADGDTLTWYDNTTLFNINSSTGIINDTPTENETGSYSILINVSDGTSQDIDSFTYQINDVTYPLISYNPTTTTAGTHSQTWIFINITASDTNKDTVTFEWNGANETFDNSSGDIYWENKTNLTDGTYTIKAYINDTIGHTNSTDLRTIILDTTIQIGITSYPTGLIISFCGNGICETDENNTLHSKYCPQDCGGEKIVIKREQLPVIIVGVVLFILFCFFLLYLSEISNSFKKIAKKKKILYKS